MFDEEKQKLLFHRSRKLLEGIDREIQKRKKIKMIFFICLLMWGCAGMKVIAEKIFVRPAELALAFAATDIRMHKSMIELTAFYGGHYLSEADKMDLVRHIAEELGIQVDKETVNRWEYEDKEAVTYVKKAKRAETTVKCVTLDGIYSKTGMKEHYLFVRIIIEEDKNNDILEYKKQILPLFKDLNAEIIGETLQFTGSSSGKLTFGELDELTDKMIGGLSGKIVYENKTEELYTVYAYSRGIYDYVTLNGMKMNIQIAASYDEEKDQTILYLAAPAVSGSW